MIYLKLIWAYLKIGLFGFGGGFAMLSLIEREVVGSQWIDAQTFTDIVAISQMTPGPIGINSATYIGYTVSGNVFGSLATSIAVMLPSFILVLTTARYLKKHKDSEIIKCIFKGIRPVVVGLIASAALLLMNKENFGSDNNSIIISIIICLISFCIVHFTKIHPILVIIIAGISGLFIF